MQTAEDFILAAEKALKEGHAREALEHCRAAQVTQPGSGRAHALTSLAYLMMGDDILGREALAKALAAAPLDSHVRYLAYHAYGRLREPANARAQLTYFCELEPDNAGAKQVLAKLGGPATDIPPLDRPKAALWFDAGGHALCDSGEIGDESDMSEPPPGPDVINCPECNKRTWKGIVCKHCGVLLPRP